MTPPADYACRMSGTAGVTIERLVDHLFAGADAEPMAGELAEWLASSRRFRAFADAHRDKIRKKLRGATDAEARLDVRTELRVAYLLLADRHVELAFEAYGSTTGGPDFTVTYRGERGLNLEVTRQRRSPEAGHGGPLLAKLRQLPPSAPNAVLVAIEGDRADAFDVPAAVHALRARADARDEAFFTNRGLRGTRGFYERFLRLGSVLVWCEGAVGDARASAWTNPSARIHVPERPLRACLACLRAG
jgi:hypothetical protein